MNRFLCPLQRICPTPSSPGVRPYVSLAAAPLQRRCSCINVFKFFALPGALFCCLWPPGTPGAFVDSAPPCKYTAIAASDDAALSLSFRLEFFPDRSTDPHRSHATCVCLLERFQLSGNVRSCLKLLCICHIYRSWLAPYIYGADNGVINYSWWSNWNLNFL